MDMNSFLDLWNKAKSDPVKVIELFMRAILECEKNKKKGLIMLSYVLHTDRCVKSSESPSGFLPNPRGVGFYIDQMLRKPNIVRSYIGGAPENGYSIDESNIKITVVSAVVQGDEAKVIIKSSGKDFPTPIKLKFEEGAWKIFEGVSSIATGVKPPK